jgi:chromosome partitioning protein
VAPDLFSIQGTENLGNKLVSWRKEWDQCNVAWNGTISIPKGRPQYLGYVVQMHNIRTNSEDRMTAGWAIYGKELEPAVRRNIVEKLLPLDQAIKWEDNEYRLGEIPNLHSLIPYSLEARKPVFDCRSSDGLRGAHIKRAEESDKHFEGMVAILEHVTKKKNEMRRVLY